MSFRTVEVLFHEISHIQAGLSLLLCLHLINMHTVPRGLLLCVLVYTYVVLLYFEDTYMDM